MKGHFASLKHATNLEEVPRVRCHFKEGSYIAEPLSSGDISPDLYRLKVYSDHKFCEKIYTLPAKEKEKFIQSYGLRILRFLLLKLEDNLGEINHILSSKRNDGKMNISPVQLNAFFGNELHYYLGKMGYPTKKEGTLIGLFLYLKDEAGHFAITKEAIDLFKNNAREYEEVIKEYKKCHPEDMRMRNYVKKDSSSVRLPRSAKNKRKEELILETKEESNKKKEKTTKKVRVLKALSLAKKQQILDDASASLRRERELLLKRAKEAGVSLSKEEVHKLRNKEDRARAVKLGKLLRSRQVDE